MKSIFKLLNIFALIIFTANVFAQQLPQYSDYMINYVALNPAAAGTTGCLMGRIGYRSQWVGAAAAPQTGFFTVHKNIEKRKGTISQDKHAWGLKIESDGTGVNGPISMLSIQGAYAYHKPVGTGKYLSFGIYAGIIQYDYKENNIKLPETSFLDDPVTAGSNNRALIYPDINPGIMYYSNNGYIGYSLKNLIGNRLSKVYGSGTSARLVKHHYLTFGRSIDIGSTAFAIIPSANIKFVSHFPPSFDLTCMFDYRNMIDVGLQYRYFDGINTIINLKLKNFTIGYVYDYNLSAMKYGSGNGHELVFGYRFCVEEPIDKLQKEHCPAYR